MPIWAWFGYDEPNYTYMKDGKKLLSEIAALNPVPVYIRAHNMLTTGDGKAAMKWGSTNAYTEDAAGNPIYNWRIVDSIFDTYVSRGLKPMAELSFMPEAMSTKPQPYKHDWVPGQNYGKIYTGWRYPPKDYKKWGELVYQWVKHSIERYGQKEVESWYWELWNEPDIAYWGGVAVWFSLCFPVGLGICLTNYEQPACQLFMCLMFNEIIFSGEWPVGFMTVIYAQEIDTCPGSRHFAIGVRRVGAKPRFTLRLPL